MTANAERTFIDVTESLEAIRLIAERDGGFRSEFETEQERVDYDDVPQIPTADCINLTAHASVMYYGDRLILSTETVQLTMSKTDYDMFRRVVKCFTDMIMGTYTIKDVQHLREDHDHLLKRWDSNNGNSHSVHNMSAEDPRRALSDEIHKMIKNMLETPVYYTSSCMALIACGAMLRDLFKTTMKREAKDFEDLMYFVRKHVRHNPVNPFDCECAPGNECSASYKTLLSLILEVPPVIHNQTYMLQILAYLIYDKDGREEIFVVNMKNVVSPGLLDKVPARLAMLVGSLDEKIIRSRMKVLLRETAGFNIGTGSITPPSKAQYNRKILENIVSAVHDPRIAKVIEALPGVRNATVELIFERCKDRRVCLNANNEGDINLPKNNNYGKNRCCGYLKLDPVGMLASSISMVQLCVYLWTDTRNAPARNQRHFFIRDILVAMAKCSLGMDDESLQDIFGYLDRCDVFKGFAHNPIFTSTFYKLFQAYLKSMKNISNRIKTRGRKVNRILEKITDGRG